PRGSPSLSPLAALWQLAQAIVLFPDRRRSKKSSLPRATLSGVWGLSAGIGTVPRTAAALTGRARSVLQATAVTATAAARGVTMSHGQRGPMGIFPPSELAPFRNGGNLPAGPRKGSARHSAPTAVERRRGPTRGDRGGAGAVAG